MTEADRTEIGESTAHERQGSGSDASAAANDPAGPADDGEPGRGSLPEVPDVPAEDVPKPDPDKDQG
jgi:hypothetical protein